MERGNSGHKRKNAEPALLHGRLQQQPGKLESLFETVRLISTLNDAVSHWLGDPEQTSVRVANLRDQTLVIFSDSAAATATLRYQRDALLSYLQHQHGYEVNRLEIKVKPLPLGPNSSRET